ncbi:hypothetical protein EWE75_17765 [Sphingomonas populi]|uniref:Uncharacterized protein n=1 Tax=Sphingomonas populi TaxID=2484750 RepID=A0A4Q6XSD6_9SPHN|nr:hypothetical protein [Sphingomonas populi]RZF63160.1 hypothetical protein EWE75_17765 [Sphingomonas populi]
MKAATDYPFEKAMAEWSTRGLANDLNGQRTVRDKYIILQMRAIDARYRAFLTGLAQQSRGTSLVLDVATLGLTGGASFAAQKTAHILSSGATAVVGGRAAFNKDLFYERTLPALIDEMNTARTKAQASLTAGIGRTADQYNLAMADIDLSRYQDAANLDTALQQLTGAAAAHVEAANALYTADFKGCLPKSEVYLPRGKMITYLNSLTNDAGKPTLAKIVGPGNLGLVPDPAAKTPQELADVIRQYITVKVCDLASAKQVAATWDDPNHLLGDLK